MARIMHIADCHLGCRQYGMRRREEDFYAAFADAADKAIEEKVDAVVIAGDLFDSVKPTAEAVYIVSKVVKGLDNAGIRVFGIEGNHDFTGDGYWLEVCGITPLSNVEDSLNDFKLCDIRIAGIPYMRPDNLVQTINAAADAGTEVDVLVLHTGFVEMGDSYSGELSVNSVLPALKKMGVRYVALGHIHIPMEPVFGGIHFAQPGSIELKDVSEPFAKQALIVEIDGESGNVTQRPVPIASRPVDVFTVSNDEELHNLLEMAAKKMLWRHFVIANVANTIPDGARRIEEGLAAADAVFRICVFDATTGVSGTTEYEREKAMPTLAAAVDAFFDEDDERHRLVTEILRTPANLRVIVENFMKKTA